MKILDKIDPKKSGSLKNSEVNIRTSYVCNCRTGTGRILDFWIFWKLCNLVWTFSRKSSNRKSKSRNCCKMTLFPLQLLTTLELRNPKFAVVE